MSNFNIVTGNFIEAMDIINPDIVMSFMTDRGVLWGFSKSLAEEYSEVREMLNVNHGEVIGKWQYKKTHTQTMVMGYIYSPITQHMYQKAHVFGLFESIASVIRAMVAEGKRTLMLQYPGQSVSGMDIYNFTALLAEARAGFDIEFYITVNPMIGRRYQQQGDVKHYDSKARVRQRNHVNFVECDAPNPLVNNFEPNWQTHEQHGYQSPINSNQQMIGGWGQHSFA